MNKLVVAALVLTLVFAPTGAFAASKPSVEIVFPKKGASYDRTEKMPVNWELENITRPMVVVSTIKLVKMDTKNPAVGYTSGGSRQDVVYPGQTTGGFIEDWGLNSTIPGKYSVTSELRECNPKGCDQAPAGKLVGKKGKAIKVTVRNDAGWTSGVTNSSGTTVTITSPNGEEEYTYARKLSVKWEAENVPKGSIACVTLEKRGGNGGAFAFPPDGGSCKSVKDGKGSVSAKIIRTAGYDLSPGEYWARVSISEKASRAGKDGATLAQDISDDYFEIR